MMLLHQRRMGTAVVPGMVGSAGVAFPGDVWPYWIRQASTNVAVQTLLFPKLMKLSW